jgi:hypothetical protein
VIDAHHQKLIELLNKTLKWLHYPGHTTCGNMPNNGGVSNEFESFVPV